MAAAAVVLSGAGQYAHADGASPEPGHAFVDAAGIRIDASAVDRDVFHIVAYPADEPQPPVSPFVVETRPLSKSIVRRSLSQGAVIETPGATLNIDRNGVFTVTAAGSAPLIRGGRITANKQAVTIALTHAAGQRLYGAGNANMNSSGDLTHPSGQQATMNGVTRIPFLWSPGGYGVLIANNGYGVSWSDSQDTLTWTVPGPYADVYVIAAPGGGYQVLNAYSRLTGRAPIPPRWTLGYMQSRWGYADAADIQDKWHQFRDRKIPVDAFIYDYDWFTDDWQFEPKKFPDGSLAEMKKLGLRFVGIRKPRVTGPNMDYAKQRGWILTSPYGTDLRFDIPDARAWWWDKQAPLMRAGVDAWWNDEAEQTYDEFFQMASLQWTGQRALNSRRVWTLNRAFTPGMQRYGAAVWSGDINSSWSTLENQPGTLMNFSLAGMPFCGQDIGGFFGPPSPELYARWMEQGVFTPIMRSHGMLNEPRWPWAFGDEALDAMKRAIELRYRMIPYLYTAAAETSRTGAPMMRPLFLEYPSDPRTFNMKDEWIVGDGLLAAPILAKDGNRSVYLPKGDWYDFNTGKAVTTGQQDAGGRTLTIAGASLATIPVYVRAGSIVPLGPVLQYTSQAPEDPLEVRVYPGANAAFALYEDAGDDYSYLDGRSSTIPFTWDDRRHTLTVGKRSGSFPGMLKTRHMTVVLPDGRTRPVTYNGRAVSVRF